MNQRELDRLMRQPPLPHAEAVAVREALDRQRRQAQAAIRARRKGANAS
jgi:hypothetical protein